MYIKNCLFHKDLTSEERFHVEIHFSPGAYGVGQEQPGASWMGYRSQVSEREVHMSLCSLVTSIRMPYFF